MLLQITFALLRPYGLLAGGLDQGVLNLYDAGKVLKGSSEDSVVTTTTKHTGPVQALDFNPFQVGFS